VHDNCTAGNPAPSDTTCDGVDDNCNGTTDEGFVASCIGTSTNTCSGGHVVQTQCDDANSCNGAETCSAGACQAGTAPSFDDGDPCTADSCDPIAGIRHTPVAPGTSCSDGLICDGAETCLPPNATTCTPLLSGAVAWWPGDGNAREIIAGLDGTLMNGLGFQTGKVGKGFNFDGVDDALDLSSHAAALNLAGTATLEMWVKVPVDTCRTVFHLRQDSTHEQLLQVGANCPSATASSSELVTWTYTNGSTTSVDVFAPTGSRAVLIGTSLHHLAVTFDGTTTAMYIDGVARVVTNLVGTDHGHWGNFPSPVSATLGAQAGGPAGSSFQGIIDEATLYDHALTSSQITAIFTAGSSGQCKPPVCTPGANAASGTSCENGGTCDGAGMCVGP
jgi:hypothetical protein